MNERIDLSISVVTFKNDFTMLRKLFNSLSRVKLKTKIFVIDNSPEDDIKNICNKEFVYIFNNKNIGFGKGHNLAIKQANWFSKYHLVVNPDIYFEDGVIEQIFAFMEDNPDIGLAMPKVLYPDGSLQYLCRLLPNPCDLFLCKFMVPVLSRYRNSIYELKFADYNRIQDIPYLSGCFMFIRSDVFGKIGLFDEKFFMYFEDIDFCRRIKKYYRTVYYPRVSIYHGYEKGSSKNLRLLKEIFYSGVRYFNKWGWFIDRERKEINRKVLEVYLSCSGNSHDKIN